MPPSSTQNEASKCNVCSRASSNNPMQGSGATKKNACPYSSGACVPECIRSRGPHQVKRKKYRPEDVRTMSVQCTNEKCLSRGGGRQHSSRSVDVQADFDTSDDTETSGAGRVCEVCRCTSGFCTKRCEEKKAMSKRRSDSFRCPRQTTSSTATRKSGSVPGLTVPPTSNCQCTGKCTRECQDAKTASAMAALKAKKNAALAPCPSTCKGSQCTGACSNSSQTPQATVANSSQANNSALNVCASCQCTGGCSIECTLKRNNIKSLMSPEELKGNYGENACATCDCDGECNPECEKAKEKKSAAKVCEMCTCIGKCAAECENKMKKSSAGKPVCSCDTPCKSACDEYKPKLAPDRPYVPPVESAEQAAKTCESCVCVGTCSAPCEAAKAAAGRTSRTTCDPCECPNTCNEECEKAKEAAREICDECVCNAICLPACEAAKNAPKPMSCPDCTCDGVCTADCELARKRSKSASKVRISKEERKEIPPADEEASDVDAAETNATTQDAPLQPGEKQHSSSDIAGVCKTLCTCTGPCTAACTEARKVRSIGEMPSQMGGVCTMPCTCEMGCTDECERAKTTKRCQSATGVMLTCDAADGTSLPDDWVPCITCRNSEPCSAACRERMALAGIIGNAAQCSAPRESASQPCQTCPPTSACKQLQTAGDPRIETCTSTHNANIHEDCGPPCEPEGCGAPPPCTEPDAPCAEMMPCGVLVAPCTVDSGPSCSQPSSSATPSCATPSCATPAPSCSQPQQPCGPKPPCMQVANPPACGMCSKLRSLLNAIFPSKEPPQPPCPCGKKRASRPPPPSVCDCNDEDSSSSSAAGPCPRYSRPSCPPPPRPPSDDDTCLCKQLQRRKSSYTDKMQSMIGRMRAQCDDAEACATPFIKAASAFQLDVHNQQEAIVGLLQKCKQKDSYIDALIEELLGSSKSLAFDDLLIKLHEPRDNAPDFDRLLITTALNKKKSCGKSGKNVCGVDLRCFQITSVKRVGATSVLVKWTPPGDSRVIGYELVVNGLLKAKVACKERVYAILDALDFSTTIAIENYAMTRGGRATPCALAYYAKY